MTPPPEPDGQESFTTVSEPPVTPTRHRVVLPFRADTESWTEERCFIVELCGRADDAGLSIARARVAPGVTTRLHRLAGVTERYVILAGEGLVEVAGGERCRVGPLDVVVIAPGTTQRITNAGLEDLVFLCVCTPAFTPACYEEAQT